MSGFLERAAALASGLAGRDSRIVRALRPSYERALDLASGGRGVAWSVNGEPLRIDPRVRHWVPRTGEPDVFEAFRRLVRPGEQVLDVGAFLGIYAILAARWAGPSGRVLAFEPTPAVLPTLRRHVLLNGVADRVTLIEEAVGAAQGKASFVVHSDPFRNAIGAADPAGRAVGTVEVPVTTLDAATERHGFRPTLIRMDVQGLELAVLSGARRTIAASAIRILVEVHPQLWHLHGVDAAKMDALLAELGLRATPLRAGGPRYEPDGHLLLEKAGP